MTVEYRTGDLFEQGFPALAQGVNTHGRMGAGIAVEFRRRWPRMYDDYRLHCQSGLFEPGALHSWTDRDTGTVIFNLATQDRPGRHARLEWISTALSAALTICEQRRIMELGMPRVGAGIGGLHGRTSPRSFATSQRRVRFGSSWCRCRKRRDVLPQPQTPPEPSCRPHMPGPSSDRLEWSALGTMSVGPTP
jgi:O-acetyl-ADP-ribose deacetylase (regulator of RNase III)